MSLEDRIEHEVNKDPEDNLEPTKAELSAVQVLADYIYNITAWSEVKCTKTATAILYKLQSNLLIVERRGLEDRLDKWLRSYVDSLSKSTKYSETPYNIDVDELMGVIRGG